MSLYGAQKLLFRLNNDPAVLGRFADASDAVLTEYPLTREERRGSTRSSW